MQRNQVHAPVPNAILCNQHLRKGVHVVELALQNDILQAVIMIEYGTGRGHVLARTPN